MIRIAVCDDLDFELTHIHQLATEFTKQYSHIAFQIDTFSSSKKLVEKLEKQNYQIYLLDVIMPSVNGIELGEHIRKKDSSSVIIYLSSSPEFALNAFHVYAFQYLLKPIDKEMFFETLCAAVSHIKNTFSHNYIIKTKDGITAIEVSSILYAEYLNHIVHFHMMDKNVISSVSSREPFEQTIKTLLEFAEFYKPHRSFLVNLNHVKTLQERNFVMINDAIIPISRNNFQLAKKTYIDFLISTKGGTL